MFGRSCSEVVLAVGDCLVPVEDRLKKASDGGCFADEIAVDCFAEARDVDTDSLAGVSDVDSLEDVGSPDKVEDVD